MSVTDNRVLLELAADAIGFSYNSYDAKLGLGCLTKKGNYWWNPLANDGDALRLAVTI